MFTGLNIEFILSSGDNMDLTEEFASCCERRTREEPELMLADPDPKRILRVQPRPNDVYESRARDVARHVEQLREFLLEHRATYLAGPGDALDPDGAVERKRIDQGDFSCYFKCKSI